MSIHSALLTGFRSGSVLSVLLTGFSPVPTLPIDPAIQFECKSADIKQSAQVNNSDDDTG
jgi:hypothetical protein